MKTLSKIQCLGGLFLSLTSFSTTAEITTGIDADAQLPYWQYSNGAISLRLVQRLPIQSRSYFQARGFNKVHSERIALSCVFQTVVKNNSHLTTPAPLKYNLRDWMVTHHGKTQGMKTREDWAKEWQADNVNIAAQVAFEWSLYPTKQEYKAGDYNWGMSVFNLKPGSKFDLKLSWQQYGKTHTAQIKNMECAPDINLEPNENH